MSTVSVFVPSEEDHNNGKKSRLSERHKKLSGKVRIRVGMGKISHNIYISIFT